MRSDVDAAEPVAVAVAWEHPGADFVEPVDWAVVAGIVNHGKGLEGQVGINHGKG